ncbi:MAG: hypothetical protein IKR41_11605 [Bacteroidales bacterium]|nr:hypothetical protein [Bacteroidales bacterium]
MMFNDKESISIRLTPDDKELVSEFAALLELPETIQPRQFFVTLLETALSKKRPVEVSKKEDTDKIAQLSTQLLEKEKETACLANDVNELKAVIEKLKKQEEQKDGEILQLKDQNNGLQLKKGEYILRLKDLQEEYVKLCTKNGKIVRYFNSMPENAQKKYLFQTFDGTDKNDVSALFVNILFYTALMEKDPLKFCKWEEFLKHKKHERKNE